MTPLLAIIFPSIYRHGPLPQPLAQCAPDTKLALFRAAKALEQKGGRLVLSDLFRTYDMQMQSHLEYVSGKKTAYSPPPGGSLHEAGRAFDLDLSVLGVSLADFWKIAGDCGLSPIIATPDAGKDEAWHFECRGSHALVYDYYTAGKGDNFEKPYTAMAASAIVSVGVHVDRFGDGQQDAYIQSALIRLGQEPGNIDGQSGPRTRKALAAAGLAGLAGADAVSALDEALQQKFPMEFFDKTSVGASAFV